MSRLARTTAALALCAGTLSLAAPAARADETCQDVNGTPACVATVGDPTTGSTGVRVSVGGLQACVVLFAACP